MPGNVHTMIRSTSELDREDCTPMIGCRCTHTRTLYGRAMVRVAPARTVGIGRLCAAVCPVLGNHVSARSHAPVIERSCRGARLRTPKLCTSSSYGDTGRAVCRWAGRLGIRTRVATHAHRDAAGALGILGHDAMWDDGAYAGCIHPHADHPGVPDASLALLSRAHVRCALAVARSMLTSQQHGAQSHAAEALFAQHYAAMLCAASTRAWLSSRSLACDTGCCCFIRRARAAIGDVTRGELMQVQISRRVSLDLNPDPCALLLCAERANPAAYAILYCGGYFSIAGASPELLVRLSRGGMAMSLEARPIAGTRPRGKDDARDAGLRAELARDSKESSEHARLVDMACSDITRSGTALDRRVEPLMRLVADSNVHHVVSCDRRTAMRLSIAPALASTFPAGTVVGAPRSAALRVTRMVEGVRRGVYGGAAGLVTTRCAELSLAIRLPIVNKLRVYALAASGIVSGSVPESELREVCNKLTMALLPCTELCCCAVGAS